MSCPFDAGHLFNLTSSVYNNNQLPVAQSAKDTLLQLIREGQPLSKGQQLQLTFSLSLPAILANVPGNSYAYCDADGNYYWSGFGLSY